MAAEWVEMIPLLLATQLVIQDNQLDITAVVGSGAFGTVYRGTWQVGCEVLSLGSSDVTGHLAGWLSDAFTWSSDVLLYVPVRT